MSLNTDENRLDLAYTLQVGELNRAVLSFSMALLPVRISAKRRFVISSIVRLKSCFSQM